MILVLGATGHTGSRVARVLARRGLPFQIAGRSAERLAALGLDAPARVMSPDAPESLDFSGIDVVINTVGPFTELGEAVVQGAVRQGCHYVDTTGEQLYLRHVRERFHDAARAGGRAVIPACAFEYAVGDCAAALALAPLDRRADAVDVVYAVRGAGVSPGTAKSMLRVAARPMALWDGAVVERRFGRMQADFEIDGRVRGAVAIPGGEALTVPRWASVGRVATWVTMSRRLRRWARWAAPVLPLARWRGVARVADALIDRWVHAPDGTEDAFTVLAEARRGDVVSRAAVRGRDPYGLTAEVAVEGAARLVAGEAKAAGVVGVIEAFGEGFVEGLPGVSWERR